MPPGTMKRIAGGIPMTLAAGECSQRNLHILAAHSNERILPIGSGVPFEQSDVAADSSGIQWNIHVALGFSH